MKVLRNVGFVDRIFQWEDGDPNMILDDGGDATIYIILGASTEKIERH